MSTVICDIKDVMHLLSHRLFKFSTSNVNHFLQGLRQLRYNNILSFDVKGKTLHQLRHGSFTLVTFMVITMVHFNGAAHYQRTNIYSLGITALSCWRCEHFFPLFFLFSSYSLVGSACCSFFSNYFPGTFCHS